MAFNIKDFGAQYSGDYARPNLFEVTIGGYASKMYVKAATLPSATVGVIEVPYMNRKLKVPGDRTYVDWTCTVMNDESYGMRFNLLEWQKGITGISEFTSSLNVGEAHKVIEIQPYTRDGKGKKGVAQVYGWPSEIGTIDMSWETPDAIQEYTVTFAVSWDSAGIAGENGKMAALGG
tara:strand:+ start:254 stop:784 length:531 start_codon:yes stop_codon:yes gene_type:complete